MKKYIEENKRRLLNALLSIIVLILILTIVLFNASKKETNLDYFNNTVVAAIEKIKRLDVKDKFVLVEFPDKEKIISKNGKIAKSDNKKYKEFTKGYIIVYKDGTYAFRLTDGNYCASKDYNDTSVDIQVYGECEDYTIEYKNEE